MHNYGTGSHVPQGYPSNQIQFVTATGYPANPAFVPPPGFVPAAPPAHMLVPPSSQSRTPPPGLAPVQVPTGCYPVELVQFWRSDDTRSQPPPPLHWALFVRTSSHARQTPAPATSGGHGNFYELVGTPDTYTAQFLAGVPTPPETHPDWRGTHVVGWVHPSQLGTFERAVRQVAVWRHHPEWACQEWAYEVLCALARTRCQGVYVGVEGVGWAGLKRHMRRLLEAWESGDI